VDLLLGLLGFKISNAKTYEIPDELKRLRDVGVEKILADLKLEASVAENYHSR
jgi:hypothetical protein